MTKTILGANAIPMYCTLRSPGLYALASALFWCAGCSIMQQPTSPSASQSVDNGLAAEVRITPINASTIADVRRPLHSEEPTRLPDELKNWKYTVGPGDILSIVVWDHPQLTIPAGPERSPEQAGNWVSAEGTIFYPYIGELEVANKSLKEIRESITSGLRNVIPRPQVDVTIASFASQKAQITGAVESPGPVTISHIPITLLDAIGEREGTKSEADLENIMLVRNGEKYIISLQKYKLEGSLANNPQLIGGDLVVIPNNKNNEVYVMGEVNTPGIVPIREDSLSLTEALAASNGLDKNSLNARGIFVFRKQEDLYKIDVYQLDITDPTSLLLGTRFKMVKGDVVYATSAPAARWNRVINNLIPSLGALNTLLLIEDRS